MPVSSCSSIGTFPVLPDSSQSSRPSTIFDDPWPLRDSDQKNERALIWTSHVDNSESVPGACSQRTYISQLALFVCHTWIRLGDFDVGLEKAV